MKRINARQAVDMIEQRLDFNAGNLWGRWEGDNGEGGPSEYVVYSYRQWIAKFNPDFPKWDLNTQKYSVTTSKHQNYTKRAVDAWRHLQGAKYLLVNSNG